MINMHLNCWNNMILDIIDNDIIGSGILIVIVAGAILCNS